MLDVFAHSDLPHEFVLVPIHSSQLTNMGENIPKTISELKAVHITKSVLDIRIYHQLGQTENLTTQMESIPKSGLLSLFSGECFDWF